MSATPEQECVEFWSSASLAAQGERNKGGNSTSPSTTWPSLHCTEHKFCVRPNRTCENQSLNQVSLALRRIESGQVTLREEVASISGDLRNHLSQEEFSKILSWLCPPTSFTAQESLEAALRARHPGTGSWFLESLYFQRWLTSQKMSHDDLLWMTGLRKS
jgi:hypothetical protein